MRLATTILHQPTHTFHSLTWMPEAGGEHYFKCIYRNVDNTKNLIGSGEPVFVLDGLRDDGSMPFSENGDLVFPVPFDYCFFEKTVDDSSGISCIGFSVEVSWNPDLKSLPGSRRRYPSRAGFDEAVQISLDTYVKRFGGRHCESRDKFVATVDIAIYVLFEGKSQFAGVASGILDFGMNLHCITGSPSVMVSFAGKDEADFDAGKANMHWVRDRIKTVVSALGLLSCRNVTHHPAVERFNKDEKWRRRQKQPVIQYKTLKVTSPGGKREYELCYSGESSGMMPHHVCRGHFAHYTEEKPLFGKYAGRFWIPPHVKGSLKNGAVIKNYEVVNS